MTTSRLFRSSTVVLAVTIQRLLDDPTRSWGTEEQLVLDALRRSKTSLADATNEELRDYILSLDQEGLRGVLSNVKGIYHELLFVHAENTDGDEITARLFEASNHPGADVELVVEDGVIQQVQLKAVESVSHIREHLSRYPGVEVYATDEVAERLDGIGRSGFSNDALTNQVSETADDLRGDTVLGEAAEGVATSGLVAAAMTAGRVLRDRRLPDADGRAVLKDVATGGVAAVVLDVLLGNIG